MRNKDWFTEGWNGEPGPQSGFINLMEWQRGKVKYELAQLKETDIEKWRKKMNHHVTLYNILYTTIISIVCAVSMGYFFGSGIGIVSFLVALGICMWIADAERKGAEKKWQEILRKEKGHAEEKVKIAEAVRQEHIACIGKFKAMHEKNGYVVTHENDPVTSLKTDRYKSRNVKPAIIALIAILAFIVFALIMAAS